MQEEPNQKSPDPVAGSPVSRKHKIIIYGLGAVIVLGLAVLAGIFIGNEKAGAPDTKPSTQVTKSTAKKTNIAPSPKDTSIALTCATDKTAFQNKDLGLQFCYPTSWGEATVHDAKVATTDTGRREVIRFSANPNIIVGGMSDDWATSVGRGVSCLEPDNAVPALSTYNTSWHGLEGSGADVSFAVRSLPSSAGGYTIEESISDLLISGVCVQGHKVIGGSRYRVVAVNYARDFAPASGITTPAQHMAEPNVLFSTELRTQYDAVLASLAAY